MDEDVCGVLSGESMKPISDKDVIEEIDSIDHGRVTVVKVEGKRDRVEKTEIKKPWDFEE